MVWKALLGPLSYLTDTELFSSQAAGIHGKVSTTMVNLSKAKARRKAGDKHSILRRSDKEVFVELIHGKMGEHN